MGYSGFTKQADAFVASKELSPEETKDREELVNYLKKKVQFKYFDVEGSVPSKYTGLKL